VDDEPVHIYKYCKTAHATLFKLSDKVVQVHFIDGTELILNVNLRSVVYLFPKKAENENKSKHTNEASLRCKPKEDAFEILCIHLDRALNR